MIWKGKYLVTYTYHKDASRCNIHTASDVVELKIPFGGSRELPNGRIALELLSKIRKDYDGYRYEIGLVNFWAITEEVLEENQ